MTNPEFTAWCRLHARLQAESQSLSEIIGPRKDRLDALLFAHCSVKIRLEYSHWFASEVLKERLNDGDAARRNFEAFLFFVRSALDCEAFFVNMLCMLELREDIVDVERVRIQTEKRPALRELWAELNSSLDTSWYDHLNDLRRRATHRSVTGTCKFLHIGSPSPVLPDHYFVPPHPDSPGKFVQSRELGVGVYAEEKFDEVYSLVEKLEGTLMRCVDDGRVTV